MEKKLTCIVCPMGCEITVDLDDKGNILSISGNTCNRGEEYAKNELTHPMRQLTSTVGIDGGIYNRLPVILSDNIPREKMFDVMEAIGKVRVKAPVKRGDVILSDVCGLGVDLLASRSM